MCLISALVCAIVHGQVRGVYEKHFWNILTVFHQAVWKWKQ